ncbi:STAS domain-containing protein [Mycobacterium sp. MMS18-G62]
MTTTDPFATTRQDGLRLSTEWLNTSVVRISVHGDVDASNSEEVLEYVFRRGANCRTLILDLTDVSFFATAGFSALQTLDMRCTRAEVSWMLIPSKAVSRVLTVCDPRRSLPCGVA